jgi:hypothetical protein
MSIILVYDRGPIPNQNATQKVQENTLLCFAVLYASLGIKLSQSRADQLTRTESLCGLKIGVDRA